MSKEEDMILVSKLKNWDLQAFERIIDKYEIKLFSYISKITNKEVQEIENILQEIFLKVFYKINQYNQKYCFSTWLYKITYNYTIDYYKKHKKEEENIIFFSKNNEEDQDNTKLIEGIIDSDANILDNINKKEFKVELNKILNKLSKQKKEIIILKFFENLSYDEISDILEIPPWTIWTIINRTKKDLKKDLEIIINKYE